MSSRSLNMPYLLLAGAVAVMIIFIFTFLQPMISVAQSTQEEIVSAKSELAEKQTFLRTLDGKIADLELNRSNESQLSVMLPSEDRMEDALRIIHSAATASGVTLEQVNNTTGGVRAEALAGRSRGAADALPGTVLPLGVGIDSSSTYQAFRSFLAQLETTPRLMDITRLEIRVNKDQPDQVFTSLAVQFYRLAQDNSSAF